jgi:DNA-binding FadR family transcriptional regulator
MSTPGGKVAVVAAAIREDIVAGRLEVGDALPTEGALMERFEVSQHTMRAALRVLEADGLVRVHRGARGGARVQELDADALARRARIHLQVAGADLPDLLQALLVLQPGAVELAADAATDEQLAQLRACAGEVATAASMDDFSRTTGEFVLLLLAASGNQTLKLFAQVIGSLMLDELHRYLHGHLLSDEDRAFNARRFHEVVHLLEVGDGAAAAALWRAHMLESLRPDLQKPPAARSRRRMRRRS